MFDAKSIQNLVSSRKPLIGNIVGSDSKLKGVKAPQPEFNSFVHIRAISNIVQRGDVHTGDDVRISSSSNALQGK